MLAAFLAAGGPSSSDAAALTAQLEQAWAQGRAAWPRVKLEASRFAAALAKRWNGGRVLENASDAYLACACAEGDQAAARELERLIATLDGPIARASARVSPEDVRQQLLKKLVVDEGRGRRIASYAATAPLLGWLRAAAVRTALNLSRPGRREELGDNGAPEAAPSERSPESRVDRARFQSRFEKAFKRALAEQPQRARRLLRRHYLEAASLEMLARENEVHRATVARWLAAAREAVLAETRRLLREELGASPEEMAELEQALRSRLDATLSGALHTDSARRTSRAGAQD